SVVTEGDGSPAGEGPRGSSARGNPRGVTEGDGSPAGEGPRGSSARGNPRGVSEGGGGERLSAGEGPRGSSDRGSLSGVTGRGSRIIAETELPAELSAFGAVDAAYPQELAGCYDALRRRLPVLIECEKELAPYVYRSIRDRLKADGTRCLYLDGRGSNDL